MAGQTGINLLLSGCKTGFRLGTYPSRLARSGCLAPRACGKRTAPGTGGMAPSRNVHTGDRSSRRTDVKYYKKRKIMQIHKEEAFWEGRIKDGHGATKLRNGEVEAPFFFCSRFEDGSGINPEELIGSAEAGCFSMALAKTLFESGYLPQKIHTRAEVELDKLPTGFATPRIRLAVEASVPDISEDEFKGLAERAKIGCPFSKARGGTLIDLKASLAN
jgi:osmotically inducible protein OsmC